MKIGQPSELHALVTQAKATLSPKSDAGAQAAAPAQSRAGQSLRSVGVAVSVSNQARLADKARVSEHAEVDTQKVDSVRAAIQNGTYSVNPEAIADKLLSNAQELLQRTRS